MDDTKNMLQAIINGQSAMKEELLSKISSVDSKVGSLDEKVNKLDKKVDNVEKNLTKRIDKLGLQIARLEDDAPTRDEFDGLEERVVQVEQKLAS